MTTAISTRHPLRAAGVPDWAFRAAHTVPLLTLPAALWRIALLADLPVASPDMRSSVTVATAVYIVCLCVVSEGLALLTLGLVHTWGEVFPRWIPGVGGRVVPPRAATTSALLGAAAIAAICLVYSVLGPLFLDPVIDQVMGPFQLGVLIVCYAPMLGWAPMLAAVAVAYHRRRTRAVTTTAR